MRAHGSAILGTVKVLRDIQTATHTTVTSRWARRTAKAYTLGSTVKFMTASGSRDSSTVTAFGVGSKMTLISVNGSRARRMVMACTRGRTGTGMKANGTCV